jgi:G3E family GTPase
MIQFIALSGFLGAGKTTAMTAAAEQLRAAGHRVAVVTNDQGTALVDTALAAQRLDGVGEVTGGCFCCRFEDLMTVTQRLVEEHRADVVIAESVGSCTDLTATVVRPLKALHGDSFRVAPMTTLVDPLRYLRLAEELDRGEEASDLAYLFGKQLEDAAVIAVNKVDLLTEKETAEVVDSLRRRCPHAQVVTCSAARGEIGALLAAWTGEHRQDERDVAIDYGRYGVAEARLAWLNETAHLQATGGSFVPARWAETVLETIAATCRREGYVVGHVKVMVEDGSGALTKASLVDNDRAATVDQPGAGSLAAGTATINARVQCEPPELEELVRAAVRAADDRHAVESRLADERSFKPGQPVPTHRILVEAG